MAPFVELAAQEARLRGGPLRALTISPAHRAGTRVIRAMAPDRSVLALERRLDHCRRDHPDLDFRSIATHSNVLNYPEHLKRTAPRIQLVVVDPLRPGPSDLLLGSSGRATLDATGCTLLICDRQYWL